MSQAAKSGVSENPTWLFVALAAPGGIASWGIAGLLIPFLLRKHGVSVDRIAAVSAVATIPNAWSFLWSPVADLGGKRRTWILFTNGLAAVCFGVAVWEASGSLEVLTVLLVAGNVLSSLGGSTIGAVLTTVPAEVRGRSSGCYQLGNLGAGAIGGGASISLAGALGTGPLSLAVAAAVFLPALAAFRIVERPHPHLPALALFRALARDVRDVLWSWRALAGVVILCSPVGAGALTNLISSLAPDFHAPSSEVAWITGLGGGLLLGIGSLLGGHICDRIDSRTAYGLFGIFAGVVALWMALGSHTPFLYGAGYAGYALFTGFAYAAFTAMVLDILGQGRRAAATGFSVLGSFGNLPVSYMTWLDGVGYKHTGARGLLGVEALANGAGGLLLVLFARFYARRWRTAKLESTAAA